MAGLEDIAVPLSKLSLKVDRTESPAELGIKKRFLDTVQKIREEFKREPVDIQKLLQPPVVSACPVDEDIILFEDVTADRDLLWEKLAKYWSIYDYDLLDFMVDKSSCMAARVVLRDFTRNFAADIDKLRPAKKFKPLPAATPTAGVHTVRVKLTAEKYTTGIEKEVKKKFVKYFAKYVELENDEFEYVELGKYAFVYKGFVQKKNYVELAYQVSSAVKSFILCLDSSPTRHPSTAAGEIFVVRVDDRIIALEYAGKLTTLCTPSEENEILESFRGKIVANLYALQDILTIMDIRIEALFYCHDCVKKKWTSHHARLNVNPFDPDAWLAYRYTQGCSECERPISPVYTKDRFEWSMDAAVGNVKVIVSNGENIEAPLGMSSAPGKFFAGGATSSHDDKRCEKCKELKRCCALH